MLDENRAKLLYPCIGETLRINLNRMTSEGGKDTGLEVESNVRVCSEAHTRGLQPMTRSDRCGLFALAASIISVDAKCTSG